MDNISRIRGELADIWIPSIYQTKIRSQRTRKFSLDIPEKENQPSVLYTLLGFELKVGNRRFASPDLATARYLLIFARLGCREFAVPYDITVISPAADELETAWQHMLLKVESTMKGFSPQVRGRTKAGMIRQIRAEIASIGAGELMPLFDRPTRQRPKG